MFLFYESTTGTDPKSHYLPHPWTCPTYDAKRDTDPIRRFSTMHWTGRRADAQTDKSSTGIIIGGAENAGVENAGVDSRGGKCRRDNVWKAVRTDNS